MLIRFLLIAGIFTVVDIIDYVKRKERKDMTIYIFFMAAAITAGVLYAIR
ncbi:MAG: hypothetical protein FWE04_02375 [Oscillospiraceae bacterium]|nr:hypothetical protein [Oscillospiraceae bacterium]